MNWGHWITIGLFSFMLFIIGSVVFMTQRNHDSLEETDYYEQGLDYNEIYISRENLIRDNAKPIIRMTQDSLVVMFASQGNIGEIHFRRPSDAALDHVIHFDSTIDQYFLSIGSLKRGNWQLTFNWKNKEGVSYNYAQSIFVP